MIPMQKSCIPPIKVIIHTKDGQPATGSPNTRALMISKIIAIKEITVRINPKYEEMVIGTLEKFTMPSME